MIDTNLEFMFLVGLLGGGHCAGMCGSIITILSLNIPNNSPFWLMLGAYNLGRISSYMMIGALLGGVTALGMALTDTQIFQTALTLLANLMLVAMGLYLAGQPTVIHWLEQLGRPLWKSIQPLLSYLLPVRTFFSAMIVGMLWGWLPCGLVYSAAVSALATGSVWNGALTMFAFGLGTLPNLLLMGATADTLRPLLQKPLIRYLAGGIISLIGTIRLLELINRAFQ